jgi:hypothetical protein
MDLSKVTGTLVAVHLVERGLAPASQAESLRYKAVLSQATLCIEPQLPVT